MISGYRSDTLRSCSANAYCWWFFRVRLDIIYGFQGILQMAAISWSLFWWMGNFKERGWFAQHHTVHMWNGWEEKADLLEGKSIFTKTSQQTRLCISAWTTSLIGYVYDFESLIQDMLELKLFLSDLSQSLIYSGGLLLYLQHAICLVLLACRRTECTILQAPESTQRMTDYQQIKLEKYEITRLPLASTDSS